MTSAYLRDSVMWDFGESLAYTFTDFIWLNHCWLKDAQNLSSISETEVFRFPNILHIQSINNAFFLL